MRHREGPVRIGAKAGEMAPSQRISRLSSDHTDLGKNQGTVVPQNFPKELTSQTS